MSKQLRILSSVALSALVVSTAGYADDLESNLMRGHPTDNERYDISCIADPERSATAIPFNLTELRGQHLVVTEWRSGPNDLYYLYETSMDFTIYDAVGDVFFEKKEKTASTPFNGKINEVMREAGMIRREPLGGKYFNSGNNRQGTENRYFYHVNIGGNIGVFVCTLKNWNLPPDYTKSKLWEPHPDSPYRQQ